jgi:ribosomal protein S10
MKAIRIQLTAEDQKKLEQVLKRLKQRDVQSYFLAVLQEQWLWIN